MLIDIITALNTDVALANLILHLKNRIMSFYVTSLNLIVYDLYEVPFIMYMYVDM